MAIELVQRVDTSALQVAAPEDVIFPDRQLLIRIFGQVYNAVADCGIDAIAFMPDGTKHPVCCLYAPNSVSAARKMEWVGAMRARMAQELNSGHDPSEPTLWDNLAADVGGEAAMTDDLEFCDRVLMAGEKPIALLSISGRASERHLQRSAWEIIGQLQARFEAAAQLLSGENALREPLIGTYSRAFMDDILRRETARAYRHCQTLSLAIVRVEAALSSAGPVVDAAWLRQVIAVVQDCVRQTDMVASISASTLGVVMPNTGTRNALVAAGRITQRIAEGRGLPQGTDCHVGISGWDVSGPHMPEIIEQAVAAMNEAKSSGSDRPFLYLS